MRSLLTRHFILFSLVLMTAAGGVLAQQAASPPAPQRAPATAPAQKLGTPADAAAPAPASAARPIKPIKLTLERSIVIGASVSDGFGTQAMVTIPNPELGAPDAPVDAPATVTRLKSVRLTEALVAVAGETGTPRHNASAMFFMNSEVIAEKQIKNAIKAVTPPSPDDPVGIVFAIDYLFWHLYGSEPESQRLATLEQGLERIGSLPGPVVVGDLPDMRHATLMLRPQQIPTVETLAKANERLAAWAKDRPNIAIVPLTRLVLAVRSDKPVTIGGTTYTTEQARELMASDGLHATGKGVIALAQECFVQLRAKGLLTNDSTWETDPAKALARIKPAAPPVAPVQNPPR